jgi:hypothetical protein
MCRRISSLFQYVNLLVLLIYNNQKFKVVIAMGLTSYHSEQRS